MLKVPSSLAQPADAANTMLLASMSRLYFFVCIDFFLYIKKPDEPLLCAHSPGPDHAKV
jgi:hypothetical protein